MHRIQEERKEVSLQDIDTTYLGKLMASIHALVQEYETLHSSLFTKDKATVNQMHSLEALKKSTTNTQLTYYLILRHLFDTLNTAKSRKHGDERPIQALYELLTNELAYLREAEFEKTKELEHKDAALDAGIQRLVKLTHPMRDRTNVTEAYLGQIISDIQKHAKAYEKSFKHKVYKDQETVNKLLAISIPANSRNTLDAYHQILTKLHVRLQAAKDTTHPALLALHKFLVLQLQTQREADWSVPSESNGFRSDSGSIIFALGKIADHAFYTTKEEKEFNEQWAITATERSLGLAETWKSICDVGLIENPGLQITINKAIAIMGFTNDQLTTHKNKNLFALQKDNEFTQEDRNLTKERSDLSEKLRIKRAEAQKALVKKATEKHNDLLVEIDDIKSHIAIVDDSLHSNTLKMIQYHETVFPKERDTLEFLTATIQLYTRNMAAFVIKNMLGEKAKTGGKLSTNEIQHYAKTYYLLRVRLASLYAPIQHEYEAINKSMSRKIDLTHPGKSEFEISKLKNSLSFFQIPTFQKLEVTHNLEENQCLLTSGDDDYSHFKKFLTDNFSSLQTPEEFGLALKEFKHQANMNEVNNINFIVSQKYNITLMSPHCITSTTNAVDINHANQSTSGLDAAINTPLPNSPRLSIDRTPSLPSSKEMSADPSSKEYATDRQDSDGQTSSSEQQDISETRTERKLSLYESVKDFVAHDAAKRPRPTWQKIGIGLLIGLGVGLILGGIAAATMVTGGLALEIIIGVSVGLFVASTVTGTIGGKVHDYRTRDVELAQPSFKRVSSSANILKQSENSKPAKRAKRAEEQLPASRKRGEDYSQQKYDFSLWVKNNSAGLPITAQQPPVSPSGQSPRL